MSTNDVLLLNADVAPVNWLPLSAISWQNAVRLMWLDVVDVLHVYENRCVHSPSVTIEVPSVVMLRKQVRGFRTWVARNESPTSHLVFLRDLYTCQYCGQRFHRHQLTIDHVQPRCFGGRTHWDNVTTACYVCNGRRGNNVKIRPLKDPFLPTGWQLIKNMKTLPILIPDPKWNAYLQWNVDLIRVGRDRRIEATDDSEIFHVEQVYQEI